MYSWHNGLSSAIYDKAALLEREQNSLLDVMAKIAEHVVHKVKILETDNFTKLSGPIVEVGEISVGQETAIYKITPPSLPSDLTCCPLAANLLWHLHYGKPLPLHDIYYAKYMAGEIVNDVVSPGSGPNFLRNLPADLEIWFTHRDTQLITLNNLATLMRDLKLNYGIAIFDNVKSALPDGDILSHAAVVEVDQENVSIINSGYVSLTDPTMFENSTLSGFALPCVYDEIDPFKVPIMAYTEHSTIPAYYRDCKYCDKSIRISRSPVGIRNGQPYYD